MAHEVHENILQYNEKDETAVKEKMILKNICKKKQNYFGKYFLTIFKEFKKREILYINKIFLEIKKQCKNTNLKTIIQT